MNNNHIPDVNLNLNVRGMPLSATLLINEKSDELIKNGKMVCKLGLGQSPFPVPLSVVEELKVNAHQKYYLPVKGLPQLREAVADYHRRTHRIYSATEDVLIGPGSKELMFIRYMTIDTNLKHRSIKSIRNRQQDCWCYSCEGGKVSLAEVTRLVIMGRML